MTAQTPRRKIIQQQRNRQDLAAQEPPPAFLFSMKNITVGFEKYGPFVWRSLMLLLTAGLYWLQANFITRREFDQQKQEAANIYMEDKKHWGSEMEKITVLLNSLDVSVKLIDANRSLSSDHETRIRGLEKDRENHEARLRFLEERINEHAHKTP